MESFRRRLSGIHQRYQSNYTNPTTPQILVQPEISPNCATQSHCSAEENEDFANMNQSTSTAGPSQKYWMPDAVATKCYDCEAKFTTFRRRHHCRVCGQIFCSKCCGNYISGESIGCQGKLYINTNKNIVCLKPSSNNLF